MNWRAPARRSPGLARPPAAKRYGWWRAYNDLTRHSKWRLVAEMANVPVERATLIGIDLLCAASKRPPRGSVAEWSAMEYAVHFGIDPDEVARVRAALEHDDVGWIDQDVITTWYERQPDSDGDPTAAERQKRRRLKIKAERAAVEKARADRGLKAYPPSRVILRDAVTVTLDQTQTSKEESRLPKGQSGSGGNPVTTAVPDVVHDNSGDSGDFPDMLENAKLWLAIEGRRIVIERLQIIKTQAEMRIERWLRDLAGNPVALMEIIKAADATDFVGARFHNLVVDQKNRRLAGAQGEQLPLGPTVVTGKRSNHG